MNHKNKRGRRRDRGCGRVRHLDGVWRQPKKVWALIAKHESGRVWFVWMLTNEEAAFSPKITHAIDEAFEAGLLKDPAGDIPTTEVDE